MSGTGVGSGVGTRYVHPAWLAGGKPADATAVDGRGSKRTRDVTSAGDPERLKRFRALIEFLPHFPADPEPYSSEWLRMRAQRRRERSAVDPSLAGISLRQ